MKVHGATFDSARLASDWSGALTSIETSTGFAKWGSIPASDIASVTPITNENHRSFAGTAGGAVIGTLLAGPVGLVVGALISGKRTKHLVGVTLVTGEGFVAEVDRNELTLLLGAASRAANEQREAEETRLQAEEFARFAGPEEDVSNRPVLRRLSYGDAAPAAESSQAVEQEPSAVAQYEEHLRDKLKLLNFTDEDVEVAKLFRRSLGLTNSQKAYVHARLFAACIKRFTETGDMDPKGALRLRSLKTALQKLGWAPGD